MLATSEKQIRFAKAAVLLGVSRASLYRYATTGVVIRGQRIKLGSVRIGGVLKTTEESVERFRAEMQQASNNPTPPAPTAPTTPTTDDREQDRVERELANRFGVGIGPKAA